jgi:predicted ATP-dependent endonuclease of OLD family
MYDRLVFVEGMTDEQVLREFAKKIDINLAQASVGFVAIGGARNFTHYANAETLTFLGRRRVKVFFILDRDERNEVDLTRLREMLGGVGHLSILRRRELENYLLSPKALSSFVASRSNQTPPTPAEIDAQMEEICDDLKDEVVKRYVLAKMSHPLRLDRNSILGRKDCHLEEALNDELSNVAGELEELRESVNVSISSARQEVEENWPSKRDLAPGDEILRNLLRKYGIAFKKNRDGVKIARLMEASDVPEEICNILRVLVT